MCVPASKGSARGHRSNFRVRIQISHVAFQSFGVQHAFEFCTHFSGRTCGSGGTISQSPEGVVETVELQVCSRNTMLVESDGVQICVVAQWVEVCRNDDSGRQVIEVVLLQRCEPWIEPVIDAT